MNKKALIIDDCLETTNLTKFLLKKLGIQEVLTANSQEDFFKLWENCKPDFIITDWNIANDFKGDQIIAEASSMQIPVALVTSEEKANVFHKIEEIYAEAFAFIAKPLNINALKAWLDSIN